MLKKKQTFHFRIRKARIAEIMVVLKVKNYPRILITQ
jgi:hypothetical protein